MHIPSWLIRVGNFVTGTKMTAGAMVVWVGDGEVLLVRSNHGERLWGFPAGVLKKREQPIIGACRELLEETGLHCEPADLQIISANVQEHGRHIDSLFRVRKSRTDEPLASTDKFEIAEARWWPVDALPEARHETVRALAMHPDLLDPR